MSGNIGEKSSVNVLLTGFRAFPGAHTNPTEALVRVLRGRKAFFARHGIALALRLLPVVYAKIDHAIAKEVNAVLPDVILHFGLASSRKSISIETLARNRVSPIASDADGRRPGGTVVLPGGAFLARARVPTAQMVTALRQAGFDGRLSRDAGNYLCNAAFYLSLAKSHAAHVGFIHVPRLRPTGRHRSGHKIRQGLTLSDLRRAAEILVFVAAKAARRDRRSARDETGS